MDVRQLLDRNQEFQRYQEHNNDPADPQYRGFFQPLFSTIISRESGYGLDYGAGPGSALVAMLEEQGLTMKVFDPFFFPDTQILNEEHSYDFVVCTETMEHFFDPYKDVSLLVDLVKPGGTVYCMTLLYQPDIDFGGWHYRMDPTHVFFYQHETLVWLSKAFDLDLEYIQASRCFYFQKHSRN